MENKNLAIVGAILLGLVFLVGVLVLLDQNNNHEVIKKEIEEKTKEINQKIGVEKKPEIKEVKNERTGKSEKIVDNGNILSIEYEKGSIPKVDVVDAKLSSNISAIALSLDMDTSYYGIEQKTTYNFLITTKPYYEKTKKFLIYFAITQLPLSYEEYIKFMKIMKEKFLNSCEKYKEYGEQTYQQCLKMEKILVKVIDLFMVDKETYNKILKAGKDPVEFYYLYDNGTEKIYLSKNLYATLDATIYEAKNIVLNILNNLPKTFKEAYLEATNGTNNSLETQYKIQKIFIDKITNETLNKKYIKDFYSKYIEFYNKIKKPYVLIERKVINKNFVDDIFKNIKVLEPNETVKEKFNEFLKEHKINLSNLFNDKNITINKIDLKVAVKKYLDLNKILPKDYINFKDLNLINVSAYLDEIKNKLIKTLDDLYNVSVDLNLTTEEEAQQKLVQIKTQIKMGFEAIKVYLETLKETSFVDLFYQLRQMLANIYYNLNNPYNNYYYTPYKSYSENVTPPSYYVNPNENTYETEIKPINST